MNRIGAYMLDLIFPRLLATVLHKRDYLAALSDFKRTRGQVGMEHLTLAAEQYNAKRYFFQRPLSVKDCIDRG